MNCLKLIKNIWVIIDELYRQVQECSSIPADIVLLCAAEIWKQKKGNSHHGVPFFLFSQRESLALRESLVLCELLALCESLVLRESLALCESLALHDLLALCESLASSVFHSKRFIAYFFHSLIYRLFGTYSSSSP